jgi:hypothetical protein
VKEGRDGRKSEGHYEGAPTTLKGGRKWRKEVEEGSEESGGRKRRKEAKDGSKGRKRSEGSEGRKRRKEE